MFDWKTHQILQKFRDTRLLPMAGRSSLGKCFAQRITKVVKALKSCHTEFTHIYSAALIHPHSLRRKRLSGDVFYANTVLFTTGDR
jgi:hypothetical protein